MRRFDPNTEIDRGFPPVSLPGMTGYRELSAGEIIREGDLVARQAASRGQVGGVVTRAGVWRSLRIWDFDSPKRIRTHGGRHHADELLAAHLILTLFPGSELVRQDDPEEGFDFVLDAGRVYHPEAGMFDHHRGTDGVPFHPDGRIAGYSTCGLVWDYFGGAYIRSYLEKSSRWEHILGRLSEEAYQALATDLWYQLDHEMICPIDRWDLGKSPVPRGIIPAQRLIQFMEPLAALGVLGKLLQSRMHTLTSYKLGAHEILRDTQEDEGGGKVYVLGDSVVVVGNHRVEPAASRAFMPLTGEGLRLLATISPLNLRNRWVLLLEEPVGTQPEGSRLESLSDNRTFFGDNPEQLLDFARWVEGSLRENAEQSHPIPQKSKPE